LILAALQAAAAQPRRVLLLHSFGPHFPPWNDIAARFREELIKNAQYPIDLYEAAHQIGRSREAANESALLDYLHAHFDENGLDLAVAMGAPAARFVLQNRSRFFPSTPVLIAGADERTFAGSTLTANETAVAVEINPSSDIENILQVLPDTTDIAVVIGDSPLERFWVAELRRSFQRFANRVTFHWLNELPAEEMVKHVVGLPPRSAIYYATVRVDAAGVPQEGDRVFFRLYAAAKAPIFSYVDSNFGRGLVGGPLLSSGDIAHRAAAVAVRILSGEPPGNIKTPTVGATTPTYDWRELQRWGIREAALPPGSIVQFRPLSMWDFYRRELIALVAAILLQSAMITWLLLEHRRRQRAEILARKTMSELTHMNRVATVGVLSASLAHEVNQPLAGISARASAAMRWLGAEKPDIERTRAALTQIVDASHRASEIVGSVRAMFRKQSNERLPVDINALVREVLAIARIELQNHGVEAQIALDDNLPHVECDRVQLQQVILNLVMNAIEAMDATQTRVLHIRTALSKPNVVSVSIQDSGSGIDPANLDRIFETLFTTKSSGMGMGLSICRSIIESHKGRIWASAAGEKGTVMQFELPTTASPH
jgi:signal transduction histidine kinase